MEQMLNVSSNPHVRARMTTAKIMQLVTIALLPAAIVGVYNYGLKALAVMVVSTGSAVLAEWLYDHFMHKKNTVTGFQCSGNWTSHWHEYASRDSFMDTGPWQYFCHYCSKTAFRWSGTELYEPGSCSPLFPDDILCW